MWKGGVAGLKKKAPLRKRPCNAISGFQQGLKSGIKRGVTNSETSSSQMTEMIF